MSYCLNPECSQPQNPDQALICENCQSKLLLRGRYRATQTLGQGGFGRTYKAVDEDRLGSVCVIKQFLPKLQDSNAIAKATALFNQEAIRLYELGEHPQIPSLLAFFVEENRQYLVQDFVPGKNLLKELELEGAFSEAKIWAIWRDLLPTLQFVHERQVIHRDIKPENIIRREPDHRLILIDFGVAKVLDAATLTNSGTTIGSPGYMPMELLVEGRIYPASDLYGMGITSFHLLTMVSPHKLFIKYGFSWLAKWRKCLKTPVSKAFGQVLDRLLQEDHTKRYQSAAEVLEDIQKLSQMRSPSSIPSIESTLASDALLALLPSIPALKPQEEANDDQFIEDFLRDMHSSTALDTAITQGEAVFLGTETDPDAVIDAILMDIQSAATQIEPKDFQHQQYDSSVADALDDEVIDEFLKDIQASSLSATNFLDDQVGVASQFVNGETQIQEWACIQTIQAHSTGVANISFASDRQTLISTGMLRSVKSWDLTSGKLITNIIDPDSCATCSGTGKVAKITRVLGMESVQSFTCTDCAGFGKNASKGERFNCTAINILGKSLAISSTNGILKLFELTRGKFLRQVADQTGTMQMLAASPNGQILVGSGSDRSIKVWHLDRDRPVTTLVGHQGLILAMVICFDNQTLISSSSDKTIKVWNMKTGKLVRTLVGHQKAVSAIALSPNGQQLATGSHDTMVKLWDWQTGKHLLNLEGHSREISALSFSGDGLPLLASGSDGGAINIWHLGRMQLVNILVDHQERINCLAFSPSGQILVSGSSDQTLKVWRVY